MDEVASVHQSIDQRLTDDSRRDARLLLPHETVGCKGERTRNIIHDCHQSSRQKVKKRLTHLNCFKGMIWVFNPVATGNTEVIQTHHREKLTERSFRSE